MQTTDWTSFDKVMKVVSSLEATQSRETGTVHSESMECLNGKRKALEMQYQRFLHADEDNILDEYERLQEIHGELMAYYKAIPQKTFG